MLKSNELAEACELLYPYLQTELLSEKFFNSRERELKDRERRNNKLPYLRNDEMFQEYVLKDLDISEIKKALEISSTLILMSPPAVNANFSAFRELVKAYANKSKESGLKYDKSSPEEKAFRAKLALIEDWLLFSNRDYAKDGVSINSLVQRTVSKKDIGMPRAGFGDAKDKGYLYYYLQELKFVIENTDNSPKWGNFIASVIGSNLFQNISHPSIYWWTTGGLPGGAKKEQWRQVGQIGWEDSNTQMPQLNEHSTGMNNNRLRPSGLEDNFEPLLLKLLELFELSIHKDKGRNILSSLSFLEKAPTESLGLIRTAAVAEAFQKIVEAGVPKQWSPGKDVDVQLSGFSLSLWNVLEKWGGEEVWGKERYQNMLQRFDRIEQGLKEDPRPGAKMVLGMFKGSEPAPVPVSKAKPPSP